MSEKHLAVVAVILAVGYGLYNATTSSQKRIKRNIHECTPDSAVCRAAMTTEAYIVDVIKNGSSRLHFKPVEIMEGGFVADEDAEDVAHFVLKLRGEHHDEAKAMRGAPLFSSNCAGCHGYDGKGLGGTYPDLTRKPLLGMERERSFR
jgi:cytochrome c553